MTDKIIYGIAETKTSQSDECRVNRIKDIYPFELWLTTPSGLFQRVKKLQANLRSNANLSEKAAGMEIA